LITFDMGGTSTDVGLLSGGELTLTNEGRIGPYPVAVPMVDLHTIGAGGGSIAFLDDGGGLWVGPRSAGALPGPACYGRGGREPTVTDANLLLAGCGRNGFSAAPCRSMSRRRSAPSPRWPIRWDCRSKRPPPASSRLPMSR
jgi:N-methylhydantoinase A/oxoprolinase/acetone carboxylase beta subunit